MGFNMSIELKDFRAKITLETDAVLEAINRTTGKDRSEIARDILHEWALKQIDMAIVLDRMLKAEGMPGIVSGVSGNARESQGVPGNRRD